MRTFLALALDADAALAIDDWRTRHWPLAAAGDVPPQNLHVTLCFLGDVDEGRLERLAHALEDKVDAPLGLEVTFDEPLWRADGAMTWLVPSSPPDALLALGKRVRGVAGRAGIRVDKRTFRPHVTLARRVDRPPPAPLSSPSVTCRFERVTLFESVLDRHGVRYRDLADWPPIGRGGR